MEYVGDEVIVRHGLIPRRPYVVLIDVLIFMHAAVVCQFASGYADYFCYVVMLMFAVSALHHWLQYASWHHRLDRATIFLLIAGTVLPYVPQIIEIGKGQALQLLTLSAISGALMIGSGLAMRKGLFASGLYLFLGCLAIWCMIDVGQYFDQIWSIIFWGGVGGYLLSMYIFHKEWPNERRYRQVQHLIMVPGISGHLWLPVIYSAYP